MAENDNTSLVIAPETSLQVNDVNAVFFNKSVFDQLYRAATLFAKSDIIPTSYKGKPENCFIALELSARMGVPAFAVMQNVAIVNGRPGIEAKLIIAMINNSGRFVDPIEYEIVGTDPSWDKKGNKPVDPNYKVRAYATSKKTGKVLYGEWITWDMAQAEGWVSKSGSKWQSMPGQMFCYRAASFFGKLYCSDLMFGMQTIEELVDITPPSAGDGSRKAEIISRFTAEETAADPAELPLSEEEAAEVQPVAGNSQGDEFTDLFGSKERQPGEEG